MPHHTTRGLAASAVSALALTGLALVVVPATGAAVPAVSLLSQSSSRASTRADGTDGTAHLTAYVVNPASVVTFEVNLDPEAPDTDADWHDLGLTTSTYGSYVSASWDGTGPGGHDYVGERVALRAVATVGTATAYSTRHDVEVTGEDSSVDSVALTSAAVGYFAQPYADSGRTKTYLRVTGTTSATDGTVPLAWWNDATGTFSGTTAAQVQETTFKAPDGIDSIPGGDYTGFLDITAFDTTQTDLAVRSTRGSDDVTVVQPTAQAITTVSTDSPAPVRAGQSGTVTVSVLDADGEPILGAEVRRSSDGSLVGYTGLSGSVATKQAGGTTESYYANSTDADAYDGSVDKMSSPVTVATYVPAATTVQGMSYDGSVFDDDEYAPGDITVLVTDQQGAPVGAGTSVSYRLYSTAAGAPAAYSTVTTGANGQAVIPYSRTGPSGEYTLASRLTSADAATADQVITFVSGQATLKLSPPDNPATAAAGGQIDYVGRLQVAGEPLPGRSVGLTYKRGVELVPGTTADAGIVSGTHLVLRASAVTNDNGTFRFTVDDPAEKPQAPEKGGLLTAATTTLVATATSTLDGNAGAKVAAHTRFGTAGPGGVHLTLGGKGHGSAADVLHLLAPTSVAGEKVKVFKVQANGKRVLVTTRTLDKTGDLVGLSVADHNGAKVTTYVVHLVGSARVVGSDSAKVKLA